MFWCPDLVSIAVVDGSGKAGLLRCCTASVPSALRAGIGYDFQLVSEIPVEECDEPLDYIVTPDAKLATLVRASGSASAKEDIS